jgi:flagellar basal body rod protein FlgG
VANVNTPGFRTVLASPTDTAPGVAYGSGAPGLPAAGPVAASTVLEGGGVALGALAFDTAQGALQPTGRALDVAVDGPGFLPFASPGGTVYSRGGSLHADAAGVLVDAAGRPLLDAAGRPVRLPPGAGAVTIGSDGLVRAVTGDRSRVLARLVLVLPENVQGMVPLDGGAWEATPAAGVLRAYLPGAGAAGALVGGAVEASNVDLASVLTGILEAQAAYAANSRAFAVALRMGQLADAIPQG